MLFRQLGDSDLMVSALAYGAWATGGWDQGHFDQDLVITSIHESLANGINFIDTAPRYALGNSEVVVGKAVQGRRDQVIIADKCGLIWHTNKGTQISTARDMPIYRYLGQDSIAYELEQSLQRLKTDYIDLYQIHWPDDKVASDETMGALLDAQQAGKIRYIGISNATIDDIKRYGAHGKLVCTQNKFNMLNRQDREAILPYCLENKMGYLTYMPLERGLLTDKMPPEREFTDNDKRSKNPLFSKDNRSKVQQFLQTIKPIAEDYQLSLTQLVLAWTISEPGITSVLCGANNKTQAAENLGGIVELKPADRALIDAAIPML